MSFEYVYFYLSWDIEHVSNTPEITFKSEIVVIRVLFEFPRYFSYFRRGKGIWKKKSKESTLKDLFNYIYIFNFRGIINNHVCATMYDLFWVITARNYAKIPSYKFSPSDFGLFIFIIIIRIRCLLQLWLPICRSPFYLFENWINISRLVAVF